jgi:hypothetical protein
MRGPSSLMVDFRQAADRDGVSMNSFIVQAIAKRVAALRARGLLGNLEPAEQASYLDERAARSGKEKLVELIGKSGTTDDVLPGDEIQQGWLQKRDSAG